MQKLPYVRNGRDGLLDWKYTATEDIVALCAPPAVPPPPRDFENDWLRISVLRSKGGHCTVLCVKQKYSWDGPTVVPDTPATVYASAFHDSVYQFAKEIGAAWGWSSLRVLRWGDYVFGDVMRAKGENGTRRLVYYWGVRVFGGMAHWVMSLRH